MTRLCCFLAFSFMTWLPALPLGAADKKKDEPKFPAPTRGAEHKILADLVGTFDAKVKMYLDPSKPPAESTGVMTRQMILGGNFLQESYRGEFFGQTFTGLGVTGFDTTKKKFVSNWCDSMSTSMTNMQGAYDPTTKTLITHGDDLTPGGKKMKARDVLRIISADEQVLEMYRQPEGAPTEYKIMEVTYKRSKK